MRKSSKVIKALIIALILVMTFTVTFSFAETNNQGQKADQQTEQGNNQQNNQGNGQNNEGQNQEGTDNTEQNEQKPEDNKKIVIEEDDTKEVDDTKSGDDKKTDKEKKDQVKKNNEQSRKDLKKVIENSNLSQEDEEKVLGLESEIEQMEREMITIEAQLKELNKKIKTLEDKAKETKKKISKNQEGMNKRLRAMYKSGTVGFVDIVLSSDSISDVINNVDMVGRIYRNDRKSIKSLKKDYKEIKEEEEKLKKAREDQKEALSKQLETMEAQNDAILQSALIFANLDGKYSGDKLLWPVPSSHRISSKFGYRICPFHGKELHRGIDVPTYTGAPILAAYDGTVVRSTYSSGYGNYVMIAHGGGLVTLYAHNSQLVARVGQKVKTGTVIAKAGSTGPSTGTHCHFEVQVNGKLADPLGFLK